MKCDFCGKPSSEASLIAGNRKSICEFCIGDAVDVALGTKEARPIEIGDKVTVCDICESETSIYYLSRNELHICVHCIGSCLHRLARERTLNSSQTKRLTRRSSRSLCSLGHSALRTCSGMPSALFPEQELHAECRLTGR